MEGRTILKIMTGIFISLFIIALFGTLANKSYAYDNPYVVSDAQVINTTGDVEGSIIDVNKDEIVNDFKFHKLNDSVTLKINFKNVNDKKYIIKDITTNNESDNILYTLSYLADQKVDANDSFEVILSITYARELNDMDLRLLDAPIKLAILCSDDQEVLDDYTIIPTNIVTTSISNEIDNNINNEKIRLDSPEGEVKGEEVFNKLLTESNRNINTPKNFLLLLLISTFGSAVCLLLLTKDNKKQLVAVSCAIFVISAFIPVIVNASEVTFYGLVIKQPGIYDKLIVNYTVDDKEETKVVDYNSTLELSAPLKEGYTFDKWLLDDKEYDPNSPIKNDINLVASYRPNSYNVVFDKNSINATGKMSVQLLTYDKEEDLFFNTFVNSGYKFDGWNTRPDGTGDVYSNRESVKNIVTDGSITLYAQWKKVTTSNLITGKNINLKMKQLAGDTNPTYNTNNQSILEIKKSNNLPIEYNNYNYLISTNTSSKPTYMWYQDGIIYYFSEADEIYLNKDSSFMFNRLLNVKHIDTSFNTEYVTTMEQMFYKNEKLESIDLSKFNTSKVTNLKSMFSECYSIKSFNLGSFDTSKVTNYSYMFNQCYEITELDLFNFNTSSATNLSHMFSSAERLKKIDISHFNTSKVTTLDAIFSNNFELEEVVLGNIDTSRVTNLAKMFLNAKSIKKLDLSNLNTSNVTNMSQMFDGCISLEELTIPFNTSKVTNMADMFRTCNKLKSIDLSTFNTSNVTNMKGVFNGMNNLESIDVSNFVTNKVTNMQGMFSGLNKVKTIDVSTFNTSKVTNMAWMFDKMNELETIYVGNGFVTTSVTTGNQMFEFDYKLVGSNGTTYNKKNISYLYAHLDYDDNPGYFTFK